MINKVQINVNKQKYILYSDGKIYSIQKKRELKKHPNGNGYLHVKLWNGNKTIHKYIHRLIAQFFLPNPNRLNEVNHIDGIKTNNDISNLEWCTHKENIQHARKIGLFIKEKINMQNNQATWIGQQNSTRTIIKLTDIKNKRGNYKVFVKCKCGHEFLMYYNDFIKDNSLSCKKCRFKQ